MKTRDSEDRNHLHLLYVSLVSCLKKRILNYREQSNLLQCMDSTTVCYVACHPQQRCTKILWPSDARGLGKNNFPSLFPKSLGKIIPVKVPSVMRKVCDIILKSDQRMNCLRHSLWEQPNFLNTMGNYQ